MRGLDYLRLASIREKELSDTSDPVTKVCRMDLDSRGGAKTDESCILEEISRLTGRAPITSSSMFGRSPFSGNRHLSPSDLAISQAFGAFRKHFPVEGSGVVVRILDDDEEGVRHQRFILKLESGHSLLIAHNIDAAERLAPLAVDDRVSFKGEYQWNDLGGVIHWTHVDDAGEHEPGWLRRLEDK